jgi:hypothetical protein
LSGGMGVSPIVELRAVRPRWPRPVSPRG